MQDLLDVCDFVDFPFDLKPAKSPQVWAGRKDVLKILQEFKYNVEINGLVEFGVITGDHGGGKSHSLLHLKYLIEQSSDSQSPSACVYIDNPTGLGPKRSFLENYRYILNHALNRERMQSIFQKADGMISDQVNQQLAELPQPEMMSILQDETKLTQRKVEAYSKIAGESPITYRLFRSIAQGATGAWDWLTVTDEDNAEVGGEQVQPLSSHILCAKALATVIKLATLAKNATPAPLRALFVLVDQTEDISTLKATQFLEQITGWRTLIDETERNLGIMWAMDGPAEEVVANFTDAIERRQTIPPEKLRLLPLDGDEPKAFLIEVMKHFRKRGARVPFETYPFSEDGLDEAIAQTAVKIPSSLLNTCRSIFTRAAMEKRIKTKKDVLDRDTITQLI